jgi:hypothetical protein
MRPRPVRRFFSGDVVGVTGVALALMTGNSAEQSWQVYDTVSIALLSGFGVFLVVKRVRTKSRGDQNSVERMLANAGTAGNATRHTESDRSRASPPGDTATITTTIGTAGATPENTPDVPQENAAFLHSGGIAAASVAPDSPRLVIAGSGDAVVQVALPWSLSVVHIVGNSASRYFGVQVLGTGQSLVNTTDPYRGVRMLDADSGKSVALQVRATGPWAIEVLSAANVPSFDTSHTGSGDAVVRYTGGGSSAHIVGNAGHRYFGVRSISEQGVTSLVNTTQPHAETASVNAAPQFFEIEAVGSWTITVT